MKLLLGIFFLLSLHSQLRADAITFQALALAPNAGGQESYSIKYFFKEKYEASLFSTFYLQSEGQPLTGVTAYQRFSLCKKMCYLQGFIQPGVGFTQIGPHVNLTWGTILGWTLRIDLTTQLYLGTDRFLSWSYPVWAGITIPF